VSAATRAALGTDMLYSLTSTAFVYASGGGNFVALDGGKEFWKEIIPADETYIHPLTGQKLRWSRADLDTIAKESNRLATAKNERIPFPDGHKFGAVDTLGFWKSYKVEAGTGGKTWLKGRVEAATPEIASKLGTSIRDVSAYIEPSEKDSKGNVYGAGVGVLTPVCATPYPVIHSGNFEPVSLSRDGARVDVPVYVSLGGKVMAKKMARLAAALGIKHDEPDGDEKVCAALGLSDDDSDEKFAEKVGKFKKALSIDAPHKEVAKLAAEKDAADKTVASLSAKIAELEGREAARDNAARDAMIADAEKGGPIGADTKALAIKLWDARDQAGAKHVVALALKGQADAVNAVKAGAVVDNPANVALAVQKQAVSNIATGLSSNGIPTEVSPCGTKYRRVGAPVWETLPQ